MNRVLASIPCYNAMTPEPLMSFLIVSQETGRAEARREYAVRWLVGGPKVQVESVRNTSCEATLKGGATHLLMCDDDMILNPPDIIGKLLALDKDIVAPLFFRSSGNFDPLVFNLDYNGEPSPILDYPQNKLFQVNGGVGTGVMLIKRKVLEAMLAPWFCRPDNHTRGTDLDFCMRAIALGFEVWCDTRIVVKQMGMAQPVGESDFINALAQGLTVPV